MSLSKPSIHFFFEKKTTLLHRTALKDFISGIFKKEKRKLESLNFIFTSDSKVLAVNQTYLQHDYYTDIITFEISVKGEPVQSDIYISIDRVKDNAAQNQVPFKQELHRVIFHGVLHLCGYKDKSKRDIANMRAKEEHYLKVYFK